MFSALSRVGSVRGAIALSAARPLVLGTTATVFPNGYPLLLLDQQPRLVHSKRQIKKIFKGPRGQRLDALAGIDRTPHPPPEVEFPPIFEPKAQKNGWSAPPPDDFERPEYPFSVKRTGDKPFGSVGFLPVYSKKRKDGTKEYTRIKRITGDRDRFILELRAVLQIGIPKNPKDDTIRVRTGGTIEVDGNYVKDVKKWLGGLGF